MSETKPKRSSQIGVVGEGRGPVYNLRIASGLSQRDFCDQAGLSRSLVQKCEREGSEPGKLAKAALVAFAKKKRIKIEGM